VSRDQVAELALEVEREVGELGVAEIAARSIGERVLPKLRALDQVAYVRFASIYRDFRDLEGFEKELETLRSGDTGRHDIPDLAGDLTIEAPREDTDEHAPVAGSERAG
jgi:transcriptional repressor NrdR